MHLIRDTVVDFDKYLKAPQEAAHVKPASNWCQAVIDRLYGEESRRGAYLPWTKTHSYIRLRPAEVSLWAGVNGHGKSALLNQVMLSAMAQGERVCIASMEMQPAATMARMSKQAATVHEPSIQFLKFFHQWTDNKLWLYDQEGRVKSERILAVARYAHEELGVTHMVIDSLMKCGLPTAGDAAWNAQSAFIDQLCTLAKDTGLHIHLVAHMRKGDTERRESDKMDVKGSGEISDQVDNVFLVWRNKAKEDAQQRGQADKDEEPDARLTCCKNRHGEWEGRISLWYRADSMQYVGARGGRAIEMVQYSQPGESAVAFHE